jgi:hypothetical protein
MTRTELEHAIRAVCDLTDEHEVFVFGSQAILGEHPDAPPELRQSAEADISPVDREKADLIDGALATVLSSIGPMAFTYTVCRSTKPPLYLKAGAYGRTRFRTPIPETTSVAVSNPMTLRRASWRHSVRRTATLCGSSSFAR